MSEDTLDILYQDDFLVAVNKPSGWDVHRNEFNRHRPIVLQALRNQINQEVHPIHRLDGGTSGVLLFATDKDFLAKIADQFMKRETQKTYFCITRGFVKDHLCELPLRVKEKTVDAVTEFRCLKQITLPWANEKYPQSRYSFVEAKPKTGRFHQIRRHLRDLSWPIIGDTKHGDNVHNELWKKHHQIQRLMLHAASIELIHPHGFGLTIKAPLPGSFQNLLDLPDWVSIY